MSQSIASLPTFHFTQYASTTPFCMNGLAELETHFLLSIIYPTNTLLSLSNVPDTVMGAGNTTEGAREALAQLTV